MEIFQNKSLQFVLIAIIVIIVIYLIFFSKKEGFEQEGSKLEKRMSEEEIVIRPPYVRPDTRTIMSGSGFIPQKEVIPAWGEIYGVSETLDDNDLNDGEGGNYGLQYAMCSPSCCSSQYPTPHKLPYDRFVCNNKSEFVPNSYVCNNAWQNSGCLCLTKKAAAFIGSRGGNA